MMSRRSRLGTLFVAAVLAVGVSVLAIAAPAEAHNYLASSTPASGATLTELPAKFEIITNGPLLTIGGSTGGFALEVRDAGGGYYGDGCVSVSGSSMSATPTLGAPGAYTVLWQVVSTDGHSVSGEYNFTWAPAAGQAVAVASRTPPNCNGTTGGGGAPNPVSTTAADPRSTRANIGEVLWIGGAIAAILIAGLATFVVLGRRQRGK